MKKGAKSIENTVTKIGDASGVIIPLDILERLHLKIGDPVRLSYSVDGVLISPRDARMEEVMAHAERVMRENDRALRRLAE